MFLIFDGVVDSLLDAIYTAVLAIDMLICYFLKILYAMFETFSGIKNVTYNGKETSLIAVFFSNQSINEVYKLIAGMGIALAFGFAIVAVIRKTFDLDEKVKPTHGGILRGLFRTILLILGTNIIIIVAITLTNAMTRGITYAFNNPNATTKTIEFSDADYATMARIMNKIGNASVNQSKENKYNINACYNDIREDMRLLEKKGIFKYSYVIKAENVEASADESKSKKKDDARVERSSEDYKIIKNWQYDLTKIARAHNLSNEQTLGEYNEELTNAMVACMEDLSDPDFKPLKSFTREDSQITTDNSPIDAIVFLTATTHAASNSSYNENVDIMTDPLRSEYVAKNGKSIYDVSQVKRDFNIDFVSFDHLVVIFVGYVLFRIFLELSVNCVARIFNMLMLYLISPLIFAVTPLDDGEKTKQWSIAFIVQAFGVIGSLISVRLFMLSVPIIFSSNLQLFENDIFNYFGKVVMMIAVGITISQASKIVTGILANSAGMQSINASDIGGAGAKQIMGMAKKGLGVGAKGLTLAGKGAWGITKFGAKGTWAGVKGAARGVSWLYNKASGESEKNDAAGMIGDLVGGEDAGGGAEGGNATGNAVGSNATNNVQNMSTVANNNEPSNLNSSNGGNGSEPQNMSNKLKEPPKTAQ